jgi:hypothetical protein
MTDPIWFAVQMIAAGAVARLAKVWPKFPKAAIPWLALAAGYGLAFGLAIHGGATAAEASQAALVGLPAGMAAVGGHEALKPLLARFVGDDRAAKLLGKLPAPKAPKS